MFRIGLTYPGIHCSNSCAGCLFMNKYIEKLKQFRLFPPRGEGQSGEEYARDRLILGLKYGVFALAAFAVLRGVLVTVGNSVTVSNSVNGKELPIYCVECEEPKIALTFDAAWGDGK